MAMRVISLGNTEERRRWSLSETSLFERDIPQPVTRVLEIIRGEFFQKDRVFNCFSVAKKSFKIKMMRSDGRSQLFSHSAPRFDHLTPNLRFNKIPSKELFHKS